MKKYGPNIPSEGALDFLSLGARVHCLDPGILPFRKASECQIHVSGRELNYAAVRMGVPVLALGASLGYFDSNRSERLPANLSQAQRDYFGAHTYRRIGRDGIFHTDWV